MTELPLLGMAVPIAEIAGLRDLIVDQNRDLEIQDFFDVALLEGDWRARADEAHLGIATASARRSMNLTVLSST